MKDQLRVTTSSGLRGRLQVPADKSISHRSLLLGALADGASRVENFLPSGDCLATLRCIRDLGIEVAWEGSRGGGPDGPTLTIHGRGLGGLQAPHGKLDCGRSGTTMRLLAGVLAGQPFGSTLTGDPQLLKRPMERVAAPLRSMGAHIQTSTGRAPLEIDGRPLRGAEHQLKVASAQVKSAILLAGLFAEGQTVVHQPGPARDHTERMLAAMSADLTLDGLTVSLDPPDRLRPLALRVPADFSSAAFPLVAALLVPDSHLTLEQVGMNPTRTGLLDVLLGMGAEITPGDEQERGGELTADLTVRSSSLRGGAVSGSAVVRMIDEFPVLAVAATQAQGTTAVQDAAELRVKETDRIAVIVRELLKLGADIEPRQDGFLVHGPTPLRGAIVDSHGDHRLAMALAVAGLVASGETVVEGTACIADSFPGFQRMLESVSK